MIEYHVTRRAGHPWYGLSKPNFDLIELCTQLQSELDAYIENANKKFWKVWISGETESPVELNGVIFPFSAVLYKPSGINQDWHDSLKNPHPGGIVI